MTTRVAPWLEGLSDAWEIPTKPTAPTKTSATHDASSLRSSRSRIPRRSLSGLPSSLSRQNSGSHNSIQHKRNPLAQLSMNESNTLRRQQGTTNLPGVRSVSESSDRSAPCGTVQQRSKSASPTKKQETLEWRKRLLRGDVGYGDQTDLFGPSGLENIFAPSKGAENDAPKPKHRMSWLQSSDILMPSSPPPWPSSLAARPQMTSEPEDLPLDSVAEEEAAEDDRRDDAEVDQSFRSNPFDLDASNESEESMRRNESASSQDQSSPDKAFIESGEDETAANRTVSGQTELEQEDFSPVYISKHKTINGQVDYAALDSHMVKQFHGTKVDLRHPSQEISGQDKDDSNNHSSDEVEQSTFTDGPQSDSLPIAPDLSFSENLPTGSPTPQLSQHVEFKRGGYSQYGSFKRRPLSPSQSTEQSSFHPGRSGLLSPIPSEGQQRPPAPTPPKAPSTPVQSEEPKSQSSGSPLKLFGPHDTFTNNRLLRRMSQLNPDGTIRKEPQQTNLDGRSDRKVSNTSSFGNGELDHYGFDAEITVTSASDSDKDGSAGSPASDVPPPGSKTPTGFRFEVSHEVKETFKMKRKTSTHVVSTPRASRPTGQSKLNADLQPTVEEVSDSALGTRPTTEPEKKYGEGKRPPTSPFKDPTPKRRRTLHASEMENDMSTVNQSYHNQLQEAVSSRKRKDARQGDSQNVADPDVLAQRKILRPRNPTPSQRRREQIEAELREAAEEFAEQEPEKLEAVMEQIESSMTSDAPVTLEQQAQRVASEVAAFTLKVQKPSAEYSERKRSVTTQDFLNEAMMVMNLIRAKARPQSNLGSVEESEAEALRQSQTQRGDGSSQGDSLLRVSRPPSREGSGWRLRAPVQTDARVISHLRKFQEQEGKDDTDFIANSIASLHADDGRQENEQVIVVDEESNIRITGPPSDPEKDQTGTESRPVSQRSQGSTLNTQNSSGNSTGRTIGTNSTRKSDNVGTLAPNAVAHLIGDQVGGMAFDKEKQRWIRLSKSPEKAHGSFLELPSNVTSDDDPFREISDLPVDEQKELRRISSPGKPTNDAGVQPATTDDHQEQAESRTTSQETVVARPVTREGSQIQHNHSSSVPSCYVAFVSSQQDKIETRATSWSDEELARMSALGRAKKQPLAYAAAQVALSQRQNATIQPHLQEKVATVDHAPIQQVDEGGLSDLREDTELDLAELDIEDVDSPKLRQTPSRPKDPPSSTYHAAMRQLSLRRKMLTKNHTAEPHESSELSFIAPLPGDRMMSLSLSVSRPLSNRRQPAHLTELQSSPSKGCSSHILSDLPDFTVHEEDEERPTERALATRLAQHAAAEVNDRYALAVKELVKILTDTNEDEPYWEDLKQLDLHKRSLASLYGLDDFCTRVQDMDVSCNELTHLEGAPSTIRVLNARSNRLSSLTPWNHLMNLQYLDISNNQLESLNGLSYLIHLRELRADDNVISTINGVFDLDGLLKLRMRRNKLQRVDFAGSNLPRLTDLDLSDNQISSIHGLDQLCSICTLKLDGNDLNHGVRSQRTMQRLTTLSMQRCNVESLDVSTFPRLQHLKLDDNSLASIGGISQLKDLEELSLRRQALSKGCAVSIFDQSLDARIVRLSGNTIPSLNLSTGFLNLQHLELAFVGLQELPDDFGLRMPNLRTLNLNFNGLKDIRPLLNIQNLKCLSACGNRLYRLRKSVATFAKMSGLERLDLRDNPLTQGFYPSFASTMPKHNSLATKLRDPAAEDEDDLAVKMEKARYKMPSGDTIEDKKHRARLDEETLLRRRVYEMLLANSCGTLRDLDGLGFDKEKAAKKDVVWDRLVELGIIRRSDQTNVELIDS